jgi:hypothetical protein
MSYKENRGSNTVWHLNNMLWYFASKLHLSDEQMFYIWGMYAQYEKGHGLRDAAEYYFNKSINTLNRQQLAGLVAVARGPTIFKPGNERYNKRVELILRKTEKL